MFDAVSYVDHGNATESAASPNGTLRLAHFFATPPSSGSTLQTLYEIRLAKQSGRSIKTLPTIKSFIR